MYEAHPVFDTPPDGARIWRYLDLAKFIWLLKEGALYFPRADKRGDSFEGSIPRINAEAREAQITAMSRQTGRPWQWAPGIDAGRSMAGP